MTQLFLTLFLASRAGRVDCAAVNRHQPNDTMQHHPIASANFSKKILNKLAKAGLLIVGSTYIPGDDGSFANGETAYLLSDGTMKTFMQVLAFA